MSLYSEREICEGCKFAVFFECGNCLDWCRARATSARDHASGKCSAREDAESTESAQ